MKGTPASRSPRAAAEGEAALRLNDFSKTVDNALRLLSVISDTGPVPTVQLAERSGLHRTVVRRLVNTLAHHGFVWGTPKGFVVGPAVLALAEQVAPQLQTVLRPMLRALADELGETVLCKVRQGPDAVLLCQERGLRHLIRVEDEPGSRHPIYQGSSGSAILSLLPDDEIRQLLASATDEEKSRSWAHINDVRTSGYCHSSGERQRGVAAIATPVATPKGEQMCSIAVIVPDVRELELQEYAPQLLACAERVGSLLSNDMLAT